MPGTTQCKAQCLLRSTSCRICCDRCISLSCKTLLGASSAWSEHVQHVHEMPRKKGKAGQAVGQAGQDLDEARSDEVLWTLNLELFKARPAETTARINKTFESRIFGGAFPSRLPLCLSALCKAVAGLWDCVVRQWQRTCRTLENLATWQVAGDSC